MKRALSRRAFSKLAEMSYGALKSSAPSVDALIGKRPVDVRLLRRMRVIGRARPLLRARQISRVIEMPVSQHNGFHCFRPSPSIRKQRRICRR